MLIHISNKPREDISKHNETISPFMNLVVEPAKIIATRQLVNKLYTVELSYNNSDEALILLSQLSHLGDETFKFYCEVAKSNEKLSAEAK